MTEKTLAQQQAESLRKLASFIEQNEEIAPYLNYTLSVAGLSAHSPGDKRKAVTDFVRMVRESPLVKLDKDWDDISNARHPVADFGAVKVQLLVWANEVCEQVGTKTVTKKVKDPAKLAEVPEIDVTEEVPVYECKPLLAVSE
jgi:hypothetical protein